jgi:hypothetical protein
MYHQRNIIGLMMMWLVVAMQGEAVVGDDAFKSELTNNHYKKPGADFVMHDPFSGAVKVKNFSFENEDDRDFDGQPDDWIRRKGEDFPHYIKAAVDRNLGGKGKQSLRITANGGQAAYYSPQIKVDAEHSYVFEGLVRTSKLKKTAAVVSISFLNNYRQRIQRVISEPISGTHIGFQKIQIGPIIPEQGTRFCVIGCHLVNSEEFDIEGDAWFDELQLGKLPRFKLQTNFETQFRQANAPIQIKTQVTGLDAGFNYRIKQELKDRENNTLSEVVYELQAEEELPDNLKMNPLDQTKQTKREPIIWKLPSQSIGYYRVHSELMRNEDKIVDSNTSFVVLDLLKPRESKGEFGWSMPDGAAHIPVVDLVNLVKEAGIHQLKYPVWKESDASQQHSRVHTGIFLNEILSEGVVPIGLLNHPPDDIRKKFVESWRGVSEIFNLPSISWQSSIDAVMASFSSSVKNWQLGDDRDTSFVGHPRINELLSKVKKEFDRIGMVQQIGFFWEEKIPIPPRNNDLDTFLSLNTRPETSLQEILKQVQATDGSGHQRWILIRPISGQTDTLTARAADLIKKLTIAKVSGVEAIFLPDVFDADYGLLHPDGSPKELYLPWRTSCMALQNAKFIGQLRLPNGSENYVFSKNNEAIIVVWNNVPTEENIYLGVDVYGETMWGNTFTITNNPQGEHVFKASTEPLILRGCSDKVLRWMLAISFKRGKLPSTSEFHAEELRGVNTFTNGISGSVTLVGPKDWEIDPKTFTFALEKDEIYKFPLYIKIPLSTNLGKLPLRMDYVIEDDIVYKFSVLFDYEIGVDDLKLDVKVFPGKEPNQLVLEQIIINNTNPPELLDFRCSLDIPERRRQEKTITKLGSGQEIKRTYYINNVDQLKERKFKVRAEQVDGKRVLNYLYDESKLKSQLN